MLARLIVTRRARQLAVCSWSMAPDLGSIRPARRPTAARVLCTSQAELPGRGALGAVSAAGTAGAQPVSAQAQAAGVQAAAAQAAAIYAMLLPLPPPSPPP
jgi:hypothetical protein